MFGSLWFGLALKFLQIVSSTLSAYSCAISNSSFASLNGSRSTINDCGGDQTDLDTDLDIDSTIIDDVSQSGESTNNENNKDESTLIGQFNVECFLKNMYPLVHQNENDTMIISNLNDNLLETSSHSTLTDDDINKIIL